MAKTELQIPGPEFKKSFYNRLQSSATQLDDLMSKCRNLAEWISDVDTDDLDTMGVAIGQARIDLIDFRIVLDEIIAFYDGASTAQTKVPSDIVDKIRHM